MKMFLPKDALNEATVYYVNLIERSMDFAEIQNVQVSSPNQINNGDHVFTIRAGDLRSLYMSKRNLKFANWYQGVGPEEYMLLHPASMRSQIIKIILKLQEQLALSKSSFNLMISEEMLLHFSKNYRINPDSLAGIVPCYNKMLNSSAFEYEKKYSTPKFVYAGGLFAWQSIERTLSIYKMIEDDLPDASLTILTKDVGTARSLLKQYGIVRGIVKFVELAKLEEELKRYKYGFLIREDSVVNRVSTPTKMNTYLSCGIMPIYTNVIASFEDHINISPYCVKLDSRELNNAIAQKVIEHNRFNIDLSSIKHEYKKLFDVYYSDDLYIRKIAKLMKQSGLK